jgi:hypothetical protein
VLGLATFWHFWANIHPASHSVSVAATSPSSITGRMPSIQILTSSRRESSDNEEAPAPSGTPPLTFASNTITERHPASPGPQLLMVKQMLRDYRATLGENLWELMPRLPKPCLEEIPAKQSLSQKTPG